jgi:hypothetical protein
VLVLLFFVSLLDLLSPSFLSYPSLDPRSTISSGCYPKGVRKINNITEEK